jgi:hypothetical protein
MEHTDCPNCGAKIKEGTFSSNAILPVKAASLINEYLKEKQPAFGSPI